MWHRKRMVQLWDSSYKGRRAWRSALQLWNNFYSSQPVEECVLTDTHRGLWFSFPSQKRSENYFLRGIFSNQCYTLGDGRKWASGIHGLSLSSLISPGALDKQDFTSLMQRVRIKAFSSEAHWVFTHPLIVKVLFSHGQFVLRLLFQDCNIMLHSLLLKTARYSICYTCSLSSSSKLSARHLCGLLHLREIKELGYLPNGLYYAWLETKNIQNIIIKLQNT